MHSLNAKIISVCSQRSDIFGDELMERKKYGSRLTAYCKIACIMFIDAFFYFACNVAICYVTLGGVRSTNYSGMLFSYWHFLLLIVIMFVVNWLLGLYRSIWTFAGSDEVPRAFIAAAVSAFVLFLVDRYLFHALWQYSGYLPFYAYFLMFVLLFLCILLPRIGYRSLRRIFYDRKGHRAKANSKKIMIVGAGFMGNYMIDSIAMSDYKLGYPVVAVDDNPEKYNKKINGVRVKGTCEEIPEIAERYDVDVILICIPSATEERRSHVVNIALSTDCDVKISPSIDEFVDPTKRTHIRDVEINDILSRSEINLDKKVCRYLIGETVLVTGGGGSIGSELCRQIARYNPRTIVVFDIYENCAFELQNELNDEYKGAVDINVRIGSVRDIDRVREVFEEFHPGVVFHAAAHKHVPLMEDSPCEAVKNNVFGTYNVALVADEYKAKKMVIISTDKAVNPTNVMGCTKRITEIIAEYMNKVSKNTSYSAVRFGNVLGSHGSVVPIFKEQIARGGPVTVTHPDMERYFMTIPEAAQLVCQAAGLSDNGEIYVLDMGKPVKIMDLAKNLIRLSGYDIDEIGIEITGLRPGEKLYEELSLESELDTREKTGNDKIFVIKSIDVDETRFKTMMQDLSDINEDNVREKLQKYVPNFHPADTQVNS